MKQEAFSKWGIAKGLGESWTLAHLDAVSYDQFLLDFLPHILLKTVKQLNDFISIGGGALRDDQSALYEYLFPQDLPYKSWQPEILKSVMSEEAFTALSEYIEMVKTKKLMLNWCDLYMRHALYDPPYLKELHQQLTSVAEKVLQRELTPTYSYLSMYSDNGICPPHRDQLKCQWTLDLCVKQDKPWHLFVENDSFLMEENEGLVYSGSDQLHWRDQIHPGGHCDLVFFHFKENQKNK